MATGPKMRINPSMLVWARQDCGYSLEEAARKIRVKPEVLKSWETGWDSPTLRQLRALGKTYRRPAALFYLDTPPDDRPAIADFRTVHRAEPDLSPELGFEIRKAYDRRRIACELMNDMGEEIPDFDLNAVLSESAQEVAHRIRMRLGISVEAQFAWPDQYEALRSWISAVEKSGVLVFQSTDIPLAQMRGFSISKRPLPVITLNGKDSPRGRIFTLLHEFVHLTLDDSGICDLRDQDPGSRNDLETFCNYIAAEVLVPREALLAQPLVQQHRGKRWDDSDLSRLANRFKVSQEVMLLRLLLFGLADQEFYQEKRLEYRRIYAQHLQESSKEGYEPYYRRVLRANGRAYTGIVLDAFYQKIIGPIELSNYLGGIKFDHMNSIEKALLGT
ncbi:XRE family transcriptional regulator [Kyrpidia tusciae]|uniref:HTH cro/C1-type domain-containing protein n=1 Tax=Kyrpidia tusciae (strain DSM 2912 / NBRC 15312 / T2) TaxID=562970 RepID=D5WRW1_KYRT2|nr:XRE family transcriptional regulator [Kyrpidia tusciae]ADG06913.1 protein of unknown function DUF955 [Kyrpidia tusciae DSM 2912]